ncbi:MAG TPA: uroporphyrinogen decarboxylase [Verrucomicrobiota bacterium]|nr:uroporphyrinogen decarboxylase [Verrucomicrobiota bacterium]HPU57650.1 uroporphyrinogen decarboxylase [Verrucomicrobiota bacterium]
MNATQTSATGSTTLASRQRFVNACRCQPVDRPPVWLMRQAGRALPEYRKLKEKYSFIELVQNPDLAVEVTLQPVHRFGFDAAILFSDILVIPEAMGQAYRFRDTGGGVVMDFAIGNRSDIDKLQVERVCERLAYVDAALKRLRAELGEHTALIGFSGSPWTLATFMMEGGSAANCTRALALFREDRKAYHALAEKLTRAITDYLRMQARAGVDALQLFDSHGGHLPPAEFQEASGRWMRDIIAELRTTDDARSTPVIVFSLGTHGNWNDLAATGADVLGVDWQVTLSDVRKRVPERIALQGNLAPALLSDSSPDIVRRETAAVLEAMRGRPGHIFNLGHGLTPQAKLENISAMIETVRNFK